MAVHEQQTWLPTHHCCSSSLKHPKLGRRLLILRQQRYTSARSLSSCLFSDWLAICPCHYWLLDDRMVKDLLHLQGCKTRACSHHKDLSQHRVSSIKVCWSGRIEFRVLQFLKCCGLFLGLYLFSCSVWIVIVGASEWHKTVSNNCSHICKLFEMAFRGSFHHVYVTDASFMFRYSLWSQMYFLSINSRFPRQLGGSCSTTAPSRHSGTGLSSSWFSTRLCSLRTQRPSSWTSTGTCTREAAATHVTLSTWQTWWWTCCSLWT